MPALAGERQENLSGPPSPRDERAVHQLGVPVPRCQREGYDQTFREITGVSGRWPRREHDTEGGSVADSSRFDWKAAGPSLC
jgi:hypothetical protein